MTPDPGASAVTKLTAAWSGFGVAKGLAYIGIHGWSDFAGMMAGLLSLAYFVDFCWKKWKGRKQ